MRVLCVSVHSLDGYGMAAGMPTEVARIATNDGSKPENINDSDLDSISGGDAIEDIAAAAAANAAISVAEDAAAAARAGQSASLG
ncbi:MAG: hypothetical protein QOE51_2849 [Actinoplanes sp.]|jgi:hypothetical protein|nr:hypothetical protein [Actinoplanes sp.]